MVDARVSGARAERRAGSIPVLGTRYSWQFLLSAIFLVRPGTDLF